MNLPNPFAKKEKAQYYLSLLLRDEKATAVVLEEKKGQIKIIGEHEEFFPRSIEDATFEELLQILDRTISKAEYALPQNIETQDTVFGVKENWVEEARIKKEYLIKLKRVSDALGLKPIGFIVITEAIAHKMQQEEGVPVSALFVEIGKANIVITLLKAGRVVEVKTSHINGPIPEEVDTLLQSFSTEVLPSRVILFEGFKSQTRNGHQDELIQEFIKHSWSKTIPFLHVPQITTLSEGFDVKAVISGAATQMGFEVLGENETKDIKNVSTSKTNDIPEEKEEEIEDSKEKIDEVENQPKEEKEELLNQQEQPQEETDSQNVASETGFFTDKDVATEEITTEEEKTSLPENQNLKEPEYAIVDEGPKIHSYQETIEKETGSKKPFSLNLSSIKDTLLKPFKMLNLNKLKPNLPGGMGKLIIIPPLILLLCVIGLLFYIFGLKSEVVLNVKPKPLTEEQEVTFAAGGLSDFSKNVIAAEEVSVTEEGEVTKTATGKKETGENAKGAITLFSRLTQERTIPEGTVIEASNGLEFVLDSSVKLASASADASAEPKTAKVNVTASEVGKEYNLPSNTRFSVESFDSTDLVARNDTAFSGGSKKEVTVVSKKDIQDLQNDLPKSLESQARSAMKQKISSGRILLPIFTNVEIEDSSLSKKEGEEATSVTLKGTVVFDSISYDNSEIQKYSQEIIKDKIEDSVLANQGIKAEVKDIQQDDDDISSTLNLSAPLLPKYNEQEITQEIAGKSFSEAETILKSYPQVSSVTINLSPSIPFLPHILPRMSQNIKLSISGN